MPPFDAGFARYLLGELSWELDQFPSEVPELENFQIAEAEVISYSGSEGLRVRVKDAVFDVRLSWTSLTPPSVSRVVD